MRLEKYFDAFNHGDTYVSSILLTGGLINETHKIVGAHSDYILQKINTKVFQNPELMLRNKFRVLSVLGENYPINFFKTKTAEDFYKIENEIWVLQGFLEDSQVFFKGDEQLALEAGKGLAQFHIHLKACNISEYSEIIPDFHSMELRWNQMEDAIKNAKFKDLVYYKEAIELYEQLKAIRSEIFAFEKAIKSGSQTLRITHNDPKLSNMLFRENQFVCMIDLDTVMPGYWAWDVGDALRSICSSVDENSRDWEGINFDSELALFFLKSYLSEIRADINLIEIASLLDGTAHIIGIMSIRFLTDSLLGNQYWKVDYPRQTLDRAKNQYLLLRNFLTKKTKLQSSINQGFSSI
jgi:thiamine kinase-like enzyme